MKILAISGSIRQGSSNTALLKAAKFFFDTQEWHTFDLTKLPYFDPDLQYSEKIPAIVTSMRELAGQCDLILISTPEYAHGIPGLLKNGLEWLFCELTMKKPVAVIIGSAQGEWARDQLLEVLKTMDFAVTPENFHIIHGARTKIQSDGIFTDQKAQVQFETFCQSITP